MAVRNTEKAGATSLARMAGLISIATALILLIPSLSSAASNFNISLNGDSDTQMGAALKMIFVLTLITLGPTVLLTMTSFVRIVVVFSLLKTALGTQTTPPQQVLMGLALFLTVAIMWPVGQDIYTRGVGPYMEGEIEAKEALYQTITPLRKFMLKQTREADLMLFYEINKEARPDKPSDVEMHLLIPAFVISELRTAFEMGFLVFIPFLLLDMVVASLTMSLGLVMLPPALLSMPLKLMLFVLADGWNLMVGSLVRSFG
jgi:flagellar biosynthetic protein FliP